MELRTLSTFLTLAIAATALSCGDDAPPPAKTKHNYTLEVDVTDSQGNVMPRVPVTVDEKIVGHTDAEGKFTATLNEFEGQPITLGVVAPEGFHFPPETDKVTEFLKVTSVNGQESGVPVFLSAVADSLKKDYFVWIKAACDNGCNNWPVLLNGEEIARTNALGYAHFSFTDQPQNLAEIEIVTSGKYEPANPRYELELDLDSTVYRIEQPFKDPTKKKKRRVVRRSSGKKKKKSEPEKKAPDPDAFLAPKPKKKSGVIDLFE